MSQLFAGGRMHTPWQEAMERKVLIPAMSPAAFSLHRQTNVDYDAGREVEPIYQEDGMIAGVTVREWQPLKGSIEVECEKRKEDLCKVTVRIRNLSDHCLQSGDSREGALTRSFVSAHTILGVEEGEFVSLLEPAEDLREETSACTNIGTWPVLVGNEGIRDAMLSSPIILYDYPQIAPESPGSLFDGTEIDEILSLRIMTMTEDEKQEMRQSDDRTRAILERTENMPPEQFMKLHGVLRGLRPVPEEVR